MDDDADGSGPEAPEAPKAAGVATDGAQPAGASVAVDPRMRSRRIEVRRDAGRRRLKRATLVLAVVAVVVGALVATRTPLLDVDRVTVSGAENTGVDAVVEVTGVELGEPLVSVDPGAVARRVESLPWVDTARVERAWPSTVTVHVSERVPVATVQVTDDHAALVDAEGQVLAIEARGPEDAGGAEDPLVLTGIDGRIAEGEQLDGDARAALAVAAEVAERLPGVVASVSTDVDAELVEGGTIRFGDADAIDDKVTAVKTVLDEVDLACLDVLDVRVPGSPALTRHQRCS
jgi:cell division protein FtsQ